MARSTKFDLNPQVDIVGTLRALVERVERGELRVVNMDISQNAAQSFDTIDGGPRRYFRGGGCALSIHIDVVSANDAPWSAGAESPVPDREEQELDDYIRATNSNEDEDGPSGVFSGLSLSEEARRDTARRFRLERERIRREGAQAKQTKTSKPATQMPTQNRELIFDE